ncbi:MAG: bifunctional alanine racemase/tRNA (adenosine(37)-N6)-threonylcarbamoyltransferase complex ATPase subunit type 1 TsaE, partial [Pseudomonadota bacterium]
ELYDLGLDDLIDDAAVWLIEWPEIAGAVLPPWTHRVALRFADPGRDVELSHRTDRTLKN